MEQLLRAIAADWRDLNAIRKRLPQQVAQAVRNGVPQRLIARKTAIPEANIRRWAKARESTQQAAPNPRSNAGQGLDPT